MQVATAPYAASLPHPHYHPYYQLPPPGPQDHDLKRQYLALLPPQQIIEICLTFDVHVPPYVKSTIWPLDLNAAISHLQSTKNAAEKPPEPEKVQEDGNAMDSLESPAQNESSGSEQQIEKETEPRPPDKQPEEVNNEVSAPSESTSATSLESTGSTTTPTENPPNPDTPATATVAASVTSSEHSTTAPPAPTPIAATPGQPTPPQPPAYPYAYPQYPQPQYYAGGYAYPYAAYPPPPPMQPGYAPAPPPAAPQIHQPYPTVTPTSIYNNVMPIVAPGPDGQVNPDDLPSYEEMIVEALADCPDAEGWAPKDLFTWMAKRYPLQSNFRPSASQALQKAFKRGRFEKSSQGKYRLSASWEGGNTSRRTTRRPQTHPSITSQPTATPAGPPFTHAPLVHHGTTAQQPQPGYPAQPYGYQYQQQPITYTQPAATPAVVAPVANVSASVKPAETTESSDAYEAAKTILNAINFGDLLKLPADDSANATSDSHTQDDAAEHQLIASGVENLLSHVQAALANSQANPQTTQSDIPISGTQASSAPVLQPQSEEEQTGGPRAELQAQLALLAAQLAELSQSENAPPATETSLPHVISPLPQPIIPITAPTPSIPQMQPLPDLPPPMASLVPPPPPPPPMTALPSSFEPQSQSQPEPVIIPPPVPESEPEHAPPSAAKEHEDTVELPLAPLQAPLQLGDIEDSDEDDEDMEEVI
ncbi:hypothetical protein CVT24_011436 [Panaeolus cyanescens]|uniref:Histone H1 n=1 Tax=Panaeolus cyanescens TaxID=181874 RepID=A0A409VGC1_9AGAR|nr:hypothetical protein CVT24_011436 [Panaeolus cyanescens]